MIADIITTHGHVAKSVAVIMVNVPIDLDAGLNDATGEAHSRLASALADDLEFVDQVLHEQP